VLITGETGTGKELIANAIHRLDNKRRGGPFIAANCSAISSELAESEFFGHRRGAFTGADNNRNGLFRAAEGGVLFLDEISELNESLQAKLLRVLQEKRVLGVGFDREVAIDVRVIAATNRSLEEMMEQGRFREDLYHRLNVLSVNIPPLRDRYEDLRPLIEHFLTKYQSLNQGGYPTANSDFVDALTHVQLSGNARQLENIVRSALLNKLDYDTPLNLSDLTPAVWQHLSDEVDLKINPKADVQSNDGSSDLQQSEADAQSYFLNILDLNGWDLTRSLECCERSLLQCALKFTQGNKSQTARMIGITPRSVYNKVQKYKLEH
jgi:transcriptional regulator with PAS, ATPase and Fis domain